MVNDNAVANLPLFLVIDDDPSAIRLVSEALKKDGRVIFATNGMDGLTQARTRNPDIVLLDAEMPGMNGFEVCAALHSDPLTKDVPVIFITARNDIDCEIAALNAGAVDFITKPISPIIVSLRVQMHLTIKQQADELRQLSRVDGLTGAVNRRWFDELIESEWARAIRTKSHIGLLMIDVDNFKAYNDNYGHTDGDRCLKGVVAAIRSVVRDPPDIVARFGGEEFVCLLPGTDLGGATVVAQRVLEAIRACQIPHAYSGVENYVTVSIGADSQIPQQNQLWSTLIDGADRYLYKAKQTGKNKIINRMCYLQCYALE